MSTLAPVLEPQTVQKMVLLVTDKLLIGALIGIAALYGARRLERFKSSVALREHVNKLRVEHMGVFWERLSVFRAHLAELIVRRARIKTEELERVDAQTAMQLIATDTLPVQAVARIEGEVKPDLQSLHKELYELYELLERNRFWLAESLYEAHAKHLEKIRTLVFDLDTWLVSGSMKGSFEIAKHGLQAKVYSISVSEVLDILSAEPLRSIPAGRADR